MVFNLAVVFIVALLMSLLFTRLKLPGLLGMVLTGILLGPYTAKLTGIYWFNFVSEDVLELSTELKNTALIIILIRAGLGINKETLGKIGVSAVKMGFIPPIVEALFIFLPACFLLGFDLFSSLFLAVIIAAVSPAVVVPQMLLLKEKRYGEKKEVPTLILAGASLDDIFALTVFSILSSIVLGEKSNPVFLILQGPLSIVLGITGGILIGFFLVFLFSRYHMRDTHKVLIFIAVSILFFHLKNFIPIASILGIMAMGFIILEKLPEKARRLASKFNKIWVFAEIILFVLIGAQVNIQVAFDSGLIGLMIICIGLTGRAGAVYISLLGSHLNTKERLFCGISYIPKATIQAALGALPLTLGLVPAAQGETILAMAVLSIIITAPLGAIGINFSARRLLVKHGEKES